jgi:hypothetical protein
LGHGFVFEFEVVRRGYSPPCSKPYGRTARDRDFFFWPLVSSGEEAKARARVQWLATSLRDSLKT